MFRNVLLTTMRFFFRNGFNSLINVFGLAIGLATCILIFLFVEDELSYDKHFKDADNIYRLEARYIGHGEDGRWAASQGDLIPRVTARYPEIKQACKLHFLYQSVVATYGDISFNEDNVLVADTTFLEFFDLEPVYGNLKNALKGAETVVLTESSAIRYFGRIDPVGEVIRIFDKGFKVTAVVPDLPPNTHFHFDLAISMDEFRSRGIPVDEGGPAAYYSYVKFDDRQGMEQFKRKANEHIWETLGYTVAGDNSEIPEGYEARLLVHPITDIHLGGHAEKEIEANNDMQHVYIFSAVALFILIIACINYMNLTTAKSFRRAREVGLRKVLGAHRNSIFMQFMGESFFISFIAILMAILLVVLILPYFNDMTGKELALNLFSNPAILFALLGIYILVGFLSGSYPALFLSRFMPLKVLKSNTLSENGNRSALMFRRVLVILQFTISIVLIIGTITVYKQLMYIQDKKLGFGKDNVVLLNVAGIRDREKVQVFKGQLERFSDVGSAAATSNIPGQRMPYLTVRIPDLLERDIQGVDEEDGSMIMRVMSADLDVVQTLGFEITDGRAFSDEFGTDQDRAFLINESAVKAYELENPVGTRFEYLYSMPQPKQGKIVGVLKDFHYASLHSEVEPLMIHVFNPSFRYLAVRLNSTDVKETVGRIEKEWNNTFAGMPFEYFFLDSYYDNLYKSEQNLGTIVTYFTVLAIVVACLGLFGLAAYITEQRTKEIGIRKVLGASMGTIVFTLSREFFWLVVIANILAWVPAYYFLNNWLEGFAFRTGFNLWIYALTALLSVLIAITTVGMQAGKAAGLNPTKALKWE